MNDTPIYAPAFPGIRIKPGDNYNAPARVYHEGMTLRDYFAAKAMQAVLGTALAAGGASEPKDACPIAHAAYFMADAMLAERNKK